MSLSILNNIAALYAQNNLNTTQSSLQNTLNQLSSGSRINSGADDASGLAVADGLHANEAALTQSAQNASAGIGLLQTADGSLSQVTNLLDRAVTLATESANGTLTAAQVSSANQEYQNILSQIGNIGATSNFNSSAVFNANPTNIVVTDGTSGGLNTYADTVGVLNTGSVGTSAGAAVVATTLTLTPVAPSQTLTPGTYTLTPTTATDTLAGTLSLSVGGGTAKNFTIAPGSTLSQIAATLMGNASFYGTTGTDLGLTAAVSSDGTKLVITGPASGSTVAADSVSFGGTSLTDSAAVASSMSFTQGVGADLGTPARGTLTVQGAAATTDTYAGTIILTQAGATGSPVTITIAAGSTFGLATDPLSIEGQITAQIQGSGFSLATDGGSSVDPVLNFTGANSGTAIAVSGSFADTTTSTTATVVHGGAIGAPPTPETQVLTAMGSATDTFGTGSTVTINGNAITLDGLQGSAAATKISTDARLSGTGISATFNSNHQLVISGPTNGSAFSSFSATGLTDKSGTPDSSILANSSAIVSTAPTIANAAGGSVVITPSNAGDTLSGTLDIQVGSGPIARMVLPTGSVGSSALATAITNNASFHAAGITATWNASAGTLTLTGPIGAANALTVLSGNSITDSTSSAPGAGADFTTAQVSQLTSATASTILTTVNAAIADVAYQRGTIGADINQLTSASNVASAESVNLTSAEQSIRATNYGQAASDLSKYEILSQTGISALAQANTVQQEVLKLLQ